MMTENAANSHVTYKPVQKNPLDRNRTRTDSLFVYVFGIFFAIWIGSSIYAFTSTRQNGAGPTRNPTIQRMIEMTDSFVDKTAEYYDKSGATAVIWSIVFSLVVIFLILLLMRWAPKACVYIGLVCIVLGVVGNILKTFSSFGADSREHSSINLIYNVISQILALILYTIVLICVNIIGVPAIADVVEKSFRAIFFFRSLILFALAYLIIMMILITFIIASIIRPDLNNVLYFINILGGSYMFVFVYYFGRIVLAETIATWHYTQVKDEISSDTILRSVTIVCRFHLGTVAFSATLILPFFVGLYVAFKYKHNAIQKSSNHFVNLLIKIVCKLLLIFNCADYALIPSAIHGHNFIQGAKKTFQIMVKNAPLSIAVVYVFGAAIGVGSIIAITLSVITSSAMMGPINPASDFMPMVHMALNLTALLIPVVIIAFTAVHTTLFCILEDEEDKDESGEKLSRVPPNGTV